MATKLTCFCLLLLSAGCVGIDSESSGENAQTEGAAVSVVTNGEYVIKAVSSGKCIDIPSASTADGARVQQWDCNGTDAQVFRVTDVGEGFVKIENPHSNKALDIKDVSKEPGATLQQWGYGGGQNQQFQIIPLGNDEFSIRSRPTGFSLDISAWSNDNGASLVQWPYHGGANQRFRFESKGGGGGGGNGFSLVWSDEFNGANGSGFDTGNWSAEIGGAGWGNNELEYYTDSRTNSRQENGNLVITATRQDAGNYGCWYGQCQYTSARLVSKGKFEVTYGKIEARIQVPRGQGIWPAFWMLGADIGSVGWPTCGEIDIMENIGREPSVQHGSLHGPGYSGGSPLTGTYTLPNGAAFADDFHLFSVEWEQNVVRFYVDNQLFQTKTSGDVPGGARWVYDHPFFLLLNVAVGGPWPGSPDGSTQFPQQMKVDYVRVYKR